MNVFKTKKRRLIAIVIITLIIIQITSCAQKKSMLNQSVAQYLNINETNNVDNYIQDLNLKSSKNDFTVDVKQSFGNEKTVYIAFDVFFPDDVKLQSDDNQIVIKPQKAQLLTGENTSLNGFSDVIPVEINKENNSISYIYYFDGDSVCFNGTEVTFIIKDIWNMTEDICISSDSFAVSWAPTNISKIKTFDILNEYDESIGFATLSSLALSINIDSSIFASHEELSNSTKLIGTDGTPLDIKWRSCGSSDNTMRKAQVAFNEWIDLDGTQKLVIGDCSININKN